MEAALKIQRFKEVREADVTLARAWVYIDGKPVYSCYFLEPGEKDRMPAGTYHLEFEQSPKFNRKLWEYKDDVDGHSEAKIHVGNTRADTVRCQLPGKTADLKKGVVGSSRVALAELHSVLQPFEGSRVTVTISDEFSLKSKLSRRQEQIADHVAPKKH